MHHQSCKCKTNLTGEILAVEKNKKGKTHELWLVYFPVRRTSL